MKRKPNNIREKNKLSKPVNESPYSKIDVVSAFSEIRKSTRNRKANDFGANFYTFLLENKPKIYNKAMSFIEAPFWKAMVKYKIVLCSK